MGKMFNAIMLTLVIQWILFMYFSQYSIVTEIFKVFMNPTTWDASTLLLVIGALGISTAGIVIGTLFGKADFVVFGTIAAVFLGFGSAIGSLWNVFASETARFGGAIVGVSPIPGITGAGMLATLLVSPLAIWYVFVVLSWWRNTD